MKFCSVLVSGTRPPKCDAQMRTRIVPVAKSFTIDSVFLSAAMKSPMPLTRKADTGLLPCRTNFFIPDAIFAGEGVSTHIGVPLT